MWNDPVKHPSSKNRSWQKKAAPKKRMGPSKDGDRREEELNQVRVRTSEQRPQCHHLGTVALQEIHQYQKITDLLIWKLSFAHPYGNWGKSTTPKTSPWSPIVGKAQLLGALQEASEYMLVGLLEDANLCAIHTKHVTVLPQELQLALHLWGHPPIKWRNGDAVSWNQELDLVCWC